MPDSPNSSGRSSKPLVNRGSCAPLESYSSKSSSSSSSSSSSASSYSSSCQKSLFRTDGENIDTRMCVHEFAYFLCSEEGTAHSSRGSNNSGDSTMRPDNLLTIIISPVKVKVVRLRVAIAFNLAVKRSSRDKQSVRLAKRSETLDSRLLCADANTLFNPFISKSRRGGRGENKNAGDYSGMYTNECLVERNEFVVCTIISQVTGTFAQKSHWCAKSKSSLSIRVNTKRMSSYISL